MVADITKVIPASAKGPAADVRAQNLAIFKGQGLALSSSSKLTTAEKSGHYIHLDQPEIAVQAIERVTAKGARHAHGA
ncbi:hypothetical protein FH608_041095 [Nonomuraea phyllanthi]|uniref:Uncharacterized protein n=1 Tax=Nonomuraea phyllanthi TaxID=2219224 RepID=A0A5C4VKZ5_9ACTN|nr:hypothetical protein [Nonomuraea phyllanthi]KAB8189229.1 hypothetical protein FH608_041095 [Nonomuraea phyllanthi]